MILQTLTFLSLVFIANCINAAPHPTTSVFAENITSQKISDTLTYPARIDSRVNALVLSETDGVLSRLLKPLGVTVKRGDAVAVVRHSDPVYQYAPLIIRAPVSGVINQVYLTEGGLVNKGDKLVSITAPDQLRIVIEVAAQDVKSIRIGQSGELTLAGHDQPIKVIVKGLSPSVDPMLGTASCELSVGKDGEKFLSPGLIGRVQFKVNEHAGILIPENAIFYKGDQTFVRVILSDLTTKKIAVKVGDKKRGQVEILSGLKVGDQIVDRASGFVADGDVVKVEKSPDDETAKKE